MNTQVKHTPGPWQVQPITNNGQGIRYSIWANPCESLDGVIGSIHEEDNARLIAAAPAMYEALRLLLGVDACHNKMIHCGECGYCKGMAALAQAEGK